MRIPGVTRQIWVWLIGAAVVLTCALLAFHPPPTGTSPVGLAAIKVPPGFKAELVAGSDLVSYPMMGTFDERGRLFICESSGNTLDNKQMAANPDYRIRMLEDRDGDGVFDHSQVFAEKLTLPAGAVWYRNSLYVASPPDLIRFEDTDGDGVADRKEVIVTGWNMSANAASLHGPFFGPDGWLYLTDGRHGFNIKAKDGKEYRGLASRIWRVRPDGTGLEWMAGGGFDNPVELTFTPSGETIGTMTYFRDPENGERDALLHFVEGGVYPKRHPSMNEFKRTGDLMPVMTKFARIAPSGLARYRGTTFGPAYQGNLFTAQFNPHRVQRHVLIREGASFRTEDSDFLTSSDPDFHPTDVMEDADGSLLVFDTGAWFIHGCPISRVAKPEIKGSIYRIRKTGAAPVRDGRGDKLNLSSAPLPDIAKLLADSRPFVRDRAVENLVSKGEPAVAPITATRKTSPSYEARAAAVFALYRIGTPEAREAVRAALSDADFRVRLAAARCTGMSADRDAVDRLMAMARRDHPAARRQAIAALGQIGDTRAIPALLAAAANPEDRYVEHSVIYSLLSLRQPELLEQSLKGPQNRVRKAALIALDQMDGSPLRREHIEPFLGTTDKDLRSAALWVVSHHADWADVVLRYLSARLREPALSASESEAVRDALTTFLTDPKVQQLIADVLAEAPKLREKQIVFLLDTIAGSSLKEIPASWTPPLSSLLDSPNANIRLRTVDLIRSRDLPGFDQQLERIASDTKSPDQLRVSALGFLVAHNPRLSDSHHSYLLSKLGPASDAVLRQSAARVIGRSTPDRDKLLLIARKHLAQADPLIISTVLECFQSSTDQEVGEALIAVLRRSPATLGTLGEPRVIAMFARYPDKVQQLSKPVLRQLQDAQRERAQRLQKLEPLLTAGGDVGRGRRLFFGDKAACATCHTIGTDGRQVGPDLTGIGAIRSGHDLLEAIVFPSASFVPGHEVYNVDTPTERIAGVLKSQSPDAVVLVTGPDGDVRIPRSKIKSMQRSNVSLMPEGFDESLTKSELTDLLAFLQSEKTRAQMPPSSH